MRTKEIYLTVVFVLLTVGLLMFSNHQHAKAAEVEYEADWSIHVDFLDNRANAQLTVEVWEFSGGIQTDYLVTTQSLRCQASNNVEISDNEAIFHGVGRILCLVPSRQKIIENMTNGAFIPPHHCLSKDGAFAESEIVLEANPTNQLRLNPIFTLPDMALGAQMPPFSTLTTMIRFFVDIPNAISEPFTANPGLNTLEANFNQVSDPNGNDLAYQPFFVANGTLLSSIPPNIDDELSLSMRSSRLFIGYSPDTEQSLYGRIRSLDLDPGCFGTG